MTELSLQDMNYFGTSWYTIEKSGPSAAFVLAAGYANARIERTAEGLFSAGIVERLDANGRVTDVVLAFAGTQPGVEDIVTDVALLLALDDPQTARAASIYDGLLADPRYAGATIHVTGHSLGGMLTHYVLGHALVTYGRAATEARADFTAFSAPPAGDGIAAHFGVTPADFAGMVDGYTVVNDVTQVLGTAQYLGTQHFLELYQPYGPLGLALNVNAAHHSSAFLGGLGLPDWLTGEQQSAVIAAVTAEAGVNLYDPTYGSGGPVAQYIVGDRADNVLTGTARSDIVEGGGGGDSLVGGAGADRFVFRRASDSTAGATDVIFDFDGRVGDRIDLSAIDARPNRLGNNAFTFVGSQPAGLGQVSIRTEDGVTYIEANITGDSRPELVIAVHSQVPLVASDFIL